MLTLSCKDPGLVTCDFVAEADSDRHVKNAMFDHIRDEHPELITGIAYDQRRDLMRRMDLAIRPLAA
jgi:predicted small metal-binding protein